MKSVGWYMAGDHEWDIDFVAPPKVPKKKGQLNGWPQQNQGASVSSQQYGRLPVVSYDDN